MLMLCHIKVTDEGVSSYLQKARGLVVQERFIAHEHWCSVLLLAHSYDVTGSLNILLN